MRRLGGALRRPANWLQLARFATVGASGYVVNLAVFALAFDVGGTDHRAAATVAFSVALANNFWWNRLWTFEAGDGHAGFQAARYLAVSLAAFALSLVLLEMLVTLADVPEVAAQAIAIVCATPLSFLGNRQWSFR